MIWISLPYLVFVHELGHAVVAQLFGLRWRPVLVRVHGFPVAPAIGVYLPTRGLSALADLAVSLGGPFASLLLAAAAWRFRAVVAVPAGALGIGSLVPFARQDGWRAVRAACKLWRPAPGRWNR